MNKHMEILFKHMEKTSDGSESDKRGIEVLKGRMNNKTEEEVK